MTGSGGVGRQDEVLGCIPLRQENYFFAIILKDLKEQKQPT